MASNTNDAVFQRRNKQIEDAIDSFNFKQALQLIEKRMKKGEDTRFLKVGLVYYIGWSLEGRGHSALSTSRETTGSYIVFAFRCMLIGVLYL